MVVACGGSFGALEFRVAVVFSFGGLSLDFVVLFLCSVV